MGVGALRIMTPLGRYIKNESGAHYDVPVRKVFCGYQTLVPGNQTYAFSSLSYVVYWSASVELCGSGELLVHLSKWI